MTNLREWITRAEAAEASLRACHKAREAETDAADAAFGEAQRRAEAAEAGLQGTYLRTVQRLTERAEEAEALAEANFQALQESEADLANAQTRAEAAEAKLHELSVKYTVALDQLCEKREALELDEIGPVIGRRVG